VGYLLLCAESFLATHALRVHDLILGFWTDRHPYSPGFGAVVAIWRPVVRPFGLADTSCSMLAA
jgi:hypothetical protein